MKKGILISCLLAMVSTADAASLGIQDINVGMTKADVINLLKTHKDAKCYQSYCTERAYIKRAVILTYLFGKETEKLISIDVMFNNRFYDVMLNGLREKYGEPEASRNIIWQSKAGTKLNNVETIWTLPEGSILLKQIGSKIDEGSISMLNNSLVKAEMAAEKEKDKQQPGF